jgi:L-lysine exporter family protein LysE/ArgO
MFFAFIHGILLALPLILPLGVQNIFILNQGIYHSKWHKALPVVITAAICDTLLILLAVLGVSVIVLKITWVKYLLSVGGIIFLVFMAWQTWHSKVKKLDADEQNAWPLGKQVSFAASVSLLNPHAIIDTIGVIGTSSATYTDFEARASFTLATILVSWLWFFSLMTMGHFLGKADKVGSFQVIINRASAVFMIVGAVVLLKTLI